MGGMKPVIAVGAAIQRCLNHVETHVFQKILHVTSLPGVPVLNIKTISEILTLSEQVLQNDKLKSIKFYFKIDRLTVDRKDNFLGYTLDNIVASCNYCNVSKGSSISHEGWKQIAKNEIERIEKATLC